MGYKKDEETKLILNGSLIQVRKGDIVILPVHLYVCMNEVGVVVQKQVSSKVSV